MEKKRGGLTPIWVVVFTIESAVGCTVPRGTSPRVATIGGWCGASINTHTLGVEYDDERGTTCQIEVGVRNLPSNAQFGVPRHAWTNLTFGGKVHGAAPTEETKWVGVHTQFEFVYVPEGVTDEPHGSPKAQLRDPNTSPAVYVPSTPPETPSWPPLATVNVPQAPPAREVTSSTPAETPTPPAKSEEKPESSRFPESSAPSEIDGKNEERR